MKQTMPMGLRLSLLHKMFRRQMDEMLKEKDLTGVQFGVMGTLVRLERDGLEEINQKDLEKASHVTHPTMTEIIKRLEKKGFIRCETSSHDRRHKCISSTEKARELGKEIHQADEAAFRWLCDDLSEEQIKSLFEITDIMLKKCGCTPQERTET